MDDLGQAPVHVPFLALFRIGLSVHHLNKFCESEFGLSMVQWCVLKHLIDLPGSSAQELANAVGIHPSTLTPTLGRLSRKGLIFIDADPRDCRKKILSLTRQGRDALDGAEAQFAKALGEISSIAAELSKVGACLADLLAIQGKLKAGAKSSPASRQKAFA